MRPPILLAFLVVCIVQVSCKKSPQSAINHGNIVVTVTHVVDGAPLVFDTVVYTNAAGNVYSVEKLEYYLSDFKIFRNNKLYYSDSDVILVNVQPDSVITFNITLASGLQTGVYDSIAFYIGVDSLRNISYGLPQTLDNLDMAWSDMMGGGYHFLKLEGHYLSSGTRTGYAMHLGQDGFQVPTGMHSSITIKPTGDAALKMTMNVNDWFKSPAVYDFNNGAASMYDTSLMRKLALNGVNVFSGN